MTYATKISELFFESVEISSVTETAKSYTCSAKVRKFRPTSSNELNELIIRNPCPDQLQLTISVNDTPFTFDNTKSDNSKFWEKFEEEKSYAEENDEITIYLLISKKVHNNSTYCIYDFTAFISYLKSLSVFELISYINGILIDSQSYSYFNVMVPINSCKIGNLVFCNGWDVPNCLISPGNTRPELREKYTTVSHFAGITNCKVLPEDFYNDQSFGDSELSKTFNKASLVLLLSFTFDYAAINTTHLELKLNGYKTLKASLELENLNPDFASMYFPIYSWIIANGSIHDRIGLARNLISLNIDKTNGYGIDDSVFISIISGYKSYEKQNVKQYVELRNKMSDQLWGFNEKANKMVEGFASGFQKTALAFVTLFSTIVISRVLTMHNFKDIFTRDATVLAFLFLIFSLIYFFVCRWEVMAQRSRFEEAYQNMKARNEDLLTKDDINRILNGDQEYLSDLKFVNDKIRIYTRLWLSFIGLFSFVILVMYIIHEIKECSNLKISLVRLLLKFW